MVISRSSLEAPGAVEAVEMASVDSATPLAEEPVRVSDGAPLSVEPHADESVPVEPGRQQRITISPALFAIFSEEASTHLATLQHELPVLETDEITPTPHDMYRAAHTLAGISATVGITPVNRLGLALEHALLRRDNSAQPGSLEALGIIRQAIGELDLMLSALAGQQEPEVPPGLIEALDALYPANVVTPHEQSPADAAAPEQPPIAEASTAARSGRA